ncbi:TPA: hypothetical protein ACNFPO_004443 [Citrobacter freundii]|nr:hypothetical protein [Escherichia coli]HCG2937275.1 hypothetical protein [Escherichia coli]HCG3100383.1 hypothetical protein [Escherichia coli]
MKKITCANQSELAQALFDWHEGQIQNLNMILEHKDADLNFGDVEIKAGTDKHKGVQVGIILALHYLGKLPIEQTEDEHDGE